MTDVNVLAIKFPHKHATPHMLNTPRRSPEANFLSIQKTQFPEKTLTRTPSNAFSVLPRKKTWNQRVAAGLAGLKRSSDN